MVRHADAGYSDCGFGWRWEAFVWSYAMVWALLNDRVKLAAYRIFDPAGGK